MPIRTARPEDRPPRVAFRVARLLGQRRGRLEADEREQAEDHALEGRLDPRIAGDEHRDVLRSPALITSSAETKTMIPISIRPRATPTRVEIEIPRKVRYQTMPAQSSVSGTHRYSWS